MTIYSIVARGKRYLEYAALSVMGLVRGNVHPTNIFINCHKSQEFTLKTEIDVLRALGVNIYFTTLNHIAKHCIVDEYFHQFPNVQRIVQIDADCVFDGDYRIKLDDFFTPDSDISLWSNGCDGVKDHKDRMTLLLEPYKSDKLKYIGFVQDVFDVDIFSNYFKNFLTKGWIYGGIILYNRSILSKKYDWNSILKHSKISQCDETPIQYVRCDPIDLITETLNSSRINHIVNPKELNFTNGSNHFIHFAGDHYRLHNEANKNIIETEYKRLVENLYA